MEEKTDILGLLDMMPRPGFCVKEHIICKVNPAAGQFLIESGTDVRSLLAAGSEVLETLDDGCLYLMLRTPAGDLSATVTVMGDYQVFLLEAQEQDAAFQTMALVSRELRKPLDSVMRLADQLLADESLGASDQAAQLNKGLYQLLRIVGNLSYPAGNPSVQTTRNIRSIVDEVMEKALHQLDTNRVQLSYTGLNRDIYCLVDETLLERALLNLLSNAVKFTPEGGHVDVSFALKGNQLQLQVSDSGSGIAEQIRRDLFYRYLRQPGIEDSRFGLGLGMVLVRSCAAKHGGTVLVDHPKNGGTRITMTLAIRQKNSDILHSPLPQWYDYTGGWDHTLVELSDCLDSSCYGDKR
ncbi:MAG: HAMP domain-containing histidine kinase [Oscillospiraceae bacterium]|nr:HAMP domain-containing histidine kinase [Oscillospiraceae bacterium]